MKKKNRPFSNDVFWPKIWVIFRLQAYFRQQKGQQVLTKIIFSKSTHLELQKTYLQFFHSANTFFSIFKSVFRSAKSPFSKFNLDVFLKCFLKTQEKVYVKYVGQFIGLKFPFQQGIKSLFEFEFAIADLIYVLHCAFRFLHIFITEKMI